MLLLYHCYPFNKFSLDGKPQIEREPGRNGKSQRDRSIRKFQSYLGIGYQLKQSGELNKNKEIYWKLYGAFSSLYLGCVYYCTCEKQPEKERQRIKRSL